MHSISVDGLRTLADRTVIDVREPYEFAGGHVPGATNIPLSTVPERLGKLMDGVTLYIICASGGRSQQATQFLAAQGRTAVNVEGGTSAWIQGGHPVER